MCRPVRWKDRGLERAEGVLWLLTSVQVEYSTIETVRAVGGWVNGVGSNGSDPAVPVKVPQGVPKVAPPDGPGPLLRRQRREALRVVARVDEVAPVPEVLPEHRSEGPVLCRPDPLLRGKGNDLFVKGRKIDGEAAVLRPLGKQRGKVPVPDRPVPLLREDRGDAPGLGGLAFRKRSHHREAVDRNVGNRRHPVQDGPHYPGPDREVGQVESRPEGGEAPFFPGDLLAEARDDLRDLVGVPAQRAAAQGVPDAVRLGPEDAVEAGPGLLEGAGLGIGAGAGAAQ
ncbi:unnamed protein product [Pseudo-nitzschia multistriata]|uniref:Uncharacterized protein n=1 Tax=Pseudo-nitzschia multistriata TaxID=183589 RepID=A0A448YUA8_9STRA|nr:unnamed protein product [Pseudo-nitzschia multistriata]